MATLSSGVEPEQHPSCVVSEGDLCLPCKERAAIREQFKELKAKYDTLGTAMNAIHDPFIHKFPPEIASHIFRLSLPTLNNGKNDPNALHGLWSIREEWAVPLTLGSVCRKWRQLAWATPDLWTTVYIRIRPSMPRSTGESLPALLCEWLDRSGALPLTIYLFLYHDFTDFASEDDRPAFGIPWTPALDRTALLVIDLLSLHSGRWRNLHIKASADFFDAFSGSSPPNELVSLELADTMEKDTVAPLGFMISSELCPTHLKLTHFPSTSINIRWDKVTHATLSAITDDETLDFLRRAHNLEYFYALTYSSPMINVQAPILLPRLRSLYLATRDLGTILDVLNLPSLEAWTHHDTSGEGLPIAVIVSFLRRSERPLKLLHLLVIP